ncbi:hypothetical protein phiG2_16 [Lysinibacillus phage phiG2]|nr:hypothetical protein phiG2_16 [Lysinibacillus phage phiG2]
MKNGYGQVFLLLLAIGLIFLASSGKGLAIYKILTGQLAIGGNLIPPTSTAIPDLDKGQSGSAGLRG